jgi:6-pyruvoyltetrahydropterin/6-carboxytetrahydropterin synthase
MSVIRLTKEFNFEMAHALYGYEGKCKNIHGHSYELKVTLIGHVKSGTEDSDEGMLVDFGVLKKIVKDQIISPFDHALVLNDKSKINSSLGEGFQQLILLSFQPSCENLLAHFAELLLKVLPRGVKLHHLFLRETATSYAEWWSEDNE